MGTPRSPQPVKLFAGLITQDSALLDSIGPRLERAFGNTIDYTSPVLDFNYTAYYAPEFGKNLKRLFVSFRKPVALENIYRVKLRANALERTFSKNGSRRINIDPGYIELSKMVLFSTKDYSHRIYCARGIFAEITLVYRGNTFTPLPWTYPDYQTNAYISIFNELRARHKNERSRGTL